MEQAQEPEHWNVLNRVGLLFVSAYFSGNLELDGGIAKAWLRAVSLFEACVQLTFKTVHIISYH